MRLRLAVFVLAVALTAAPDAGPFGASTARAQQLQLPDASDDGERRLDVEPLRRRVEALVRSGRAREAIEILETRRDEQGFLEPVLARRLARVYRDAERWESLESLLMDGVEDEGDLDIGQVRLLAEARFELGRADEARATLDRLRDREPTDPSLVRLVANVLAENRDVAGAIEVLERGRATIEDPLEFAQLLARFHAELGQSAAAVREYARVVLASPLNVSLVRGQVLEMADEEPDDVPAMLEAAREASSANPEVPQLGLIVAELEMFDGDPEAAWLTLRPLVTERDLENELLRLALAGLADARLPESDPDRVLPRLRLSARVARAMLANETAHPSIEPRVYDTLVRSLLAILENDAFGRLARDEQLDVLDETRSSIIEMQERFAGNRLTSSALLRLAGVYVDALHEPEAAIDLYRLLSMNSSSSREDVQLASLGLARAYVATGDTATARDMFEVIGQDMDFVGGQGRAQYHLGMIDFMGGRLDVAQDRLKAVAAEAPNAEYTNDALDLALVLVEHEMAQVENDEPLLAYGRALYEKATHRPDELLNTLGEIAEGPATGIRERARMDLARLAIDARRPDEALVWTLRVADEAPMSRHAAPALDLHADVLESVGRTDEALVVYERLVVEHEDYVLMDKVRDRVRALRGIADTEEEELP